MANGRVKVVGYAQRTYYDQGIEYRNFTDDLVGQQQVNGEDEGLPYSLGNIFDTEFNNEGRVSKTFVTNKFTKFVTKADINLEELQIKELIGNDKQLYLNADPTILTNYSYFGSLREYMRVTFEKIITTWPASIYVREYNSQRKNVTTVEDYIFDPLTNVATFKVNVDLFINPYQIDYVGNGEQLSGDTKARSLPISYMVPTTTGDYNISTSTGDFNITEFTGSTNVTNSYTYFKTEGNPFPTLTGSTSGSTTYHIKPNDTIIGAFFNGLNDFESYLLNVYTTPKYKSVFNVKMVHDSGSVVYGVKSFIWPVSDGYNLDFQSTPYVKYVSKLITLAEDLDSYQTNIVKRQMVADSITEFDSISTFDSTLKESEGQKITKTVQIYGREFDEIKKYADGISFIHNTTYDKKNNVPDGLVKGLAKTLGWDITNTIVNNDLLSSYVAPVDTRYSGHSAGMSPFQSEIEFWRRLVINTPWLWKSKGTRKGVEFLLKMIGTPQGLIDFNEYVYIARKQIDMDVFNDILLQYKDTTSLANIPITNDGYPAPLKNTSNMYFQNDGLWYRETAGSGSTMDKLIGNNPHVGPYDGGFKYMNQFGCLIEGFTGATLIEETVSTGTTVLFTNYNGGSFNDIFSYDSNAVVNNVNLSAVHDDLLDKCLISLDIRNQFLGDPTTDCTILGDWTLKVYIDDVLSYDGAIFYNSNGYTGDFPSTVEFGAELDNVGTELGLSVEFSGRKVTFNKGTEVECETSSYSGKKIKLEICIDYNINCSI